AIGIHDAENLKPTTENQLLAITGPGRRTGIGVIDSIRYDGKYMRPVGGHQIDRCRAWSTARRIARGYERNLTAKGGPGGCIVILNLVGDPHEVAPSAGPR